MPRRKRKKSKPVYWGAGGQIPRGYHGPSQLRSSGVAPRASAYFGGSLTRSGFASSGAHAYAQGKVQQMRLSTDIPVEYTPPEEEAYRVLHTAALHADAQGAVPGPARSSDAHRRDYKNAAAAFNQFREPHSFASSAQSSPTLSPESPLYSGSGSGGGGGGGGGSSVAELGDLFGGLVMSPIGQPTPEATQRRRRSGTREQQETFAVAQPAAPNLSSTQQALSDEIQQWRDSPEVRDFAGRRERREAAMQAQRVREAHREGRSARRRARERRPGMPDAPRAAESPGPVQRLIDWFSPPPEQRPSQPPVVRGMESVAQGRERRSNAGHKKSEYSYH
jgi:hypothetical protein